MHLYLVHHGDAVPPEADPQRPLSARGRDQVDRLAREAAERGARPEIVWHSGKLRARQTAETYWRHCNPLAALAAVRGLQPGDPPGWIADRVAAEERDVMLVGHLPSLPRLLALLTTGPDAPAELPPNGLVCLERQEMGWTERWRLAPPLRNEGPRQPRGASS